MKKLTVLFTTMLIVMLMAVPAYAGYYFYEEGAFISSDGERSSVKTASGETILTDDQFEAVEYGGDGVALIIGSDGVQYQIRCGAHERSDGSLLVQTDNGLQVIRSKYDPGYFYEEGAYLAKDKIGRVAVYTSNGKDLADEKDFVKVSYGGDGIAILENRIGFQYQIECGARELRDGSLLVQLRNGRYARLAGTGIR